MIQFTTTFIILISISVSILLVCKFIFSLTKMHILGKTNQKQLKTWDLQSSQKRTFLLSLLLLKHFGDYSIIFWKSHLPVFRDILKHFAYFNTFLLRGSEPQIMPKVGFCVCLLVLPKHTACKKASLEGMLREGKTCVKKYFMFNIFW